MGNIVLVKKVLEGNNCQSTKKFDLEDVIKNEIVRAVFRKFAGETGQYHDEYISLDTIFDDFEKQENQNENEDWKKNLIKELNELHTAGLSNADYFTQDLKETRFEKYFRVVVKGLNEGNDYYRNQYCKFFILYSYIKPFFNEGSDSKDDFFKSLADELESTDDGGMSVYSFEMGLSLTFSLLDELKEGAPTILENAVKNIYSALIKLKTSLLEPNDYQFYSREQILSRHREYLVSLVNDSTVSQAVKDLAIKLIVLIGNLRASGEDYLVAYNLIQKHNITVNLDSELSLNKYFQSENKKEGNKETFKIDNKKNKEVDLMLGLGTDPSKYNQTLSAFDSKHVYICNTYSGLFKYGFVKTPTTKSGLNYGTYTNDNSTLKNILFLKNKLFVRNENESDRPFTLHDTRTLEPIDNEEFVNKLIKNARKEGDPWNKPILERTSENALDEAINRNEAEAYRKLAKTPLFSDGDYIYVISFYLTKPNEDRNEYELELEAYDPDTWKNITTKRLNFEPEENKDWTQAEASKVQEDTDLLKQRLNSYSINEYLFATNGKQLSITVGTQMYFFDLESGRRFQDVVIVPDRTHGYDFLTNTFWHYRTDTDGITLKSFRIDGFKSKAELNSNDAFNFSEFLKKRTDVVVQEQRDENRLKHRSIKSLLKSLGNIAPQKEEVKIAHNQSTSPSLYLILYSMSKGCEDMDKTIQELDGLYPDLVKQKLACQSKLFRSSYSVTINGNFIAQLATALEHFSNFVENDMTDDNLVDQYQFLWIAQLVNRLILTLERLNLQLSSIVEDHKITSRFVQTVSNICSKISDSGINKDQLKATNNKEEVENLWHECETEWRAIQNVLINISSESNEDLFSKLNDLAKGLESGEIAPSHRIFLQYLSQPDSLKRILDDNTDEVLGHLFNLFAALCDRKSAKLADHVQSLTLSHFDQEINYTDLESISDDFIYALVHRVIIIIYSIQADISKAIDNDQKKKQENLKKKAEANMKYYSRIFDIVSASAQRIFDAAAQSYRKVADEVDSQTYEDDKAKEHIKEKLSDYHEHLFSAAREHNKFLDFIHIYVAACASEKKHKMTKDLNNMCKRTFDLLRSYGSYCEIECKNVELFENKNLLRHSLSNDVMRFLIWSLSKISHSFIKIKEPEKKDDQDEIHRNLLRSKLFSGGLENRFLSTFSKETCQTIENIATITGDNKLMGYIHKLEKIDEDEVMEAIIHEGKDEGVDRLVKLLQWNLERKDPRARVGGNDGMTLSRSAFAGMLSLNQHEDSCTYTNFVMMVDTLEMAMDIAEGDNENQINKSLMAELNDLGTIEPILERWAMASKMRIWLQEKKKDISNSIKKKAEAELKRKQEEDRILKEEDEKRAEEEKDEKVPDDEETVETTNKNKVHEIDEEDLLRKEAEQIKVMISKVVEKAELLIKLCTPASWETSDTSKENLRAIDGYKEGEEVKSENLAQKLQKIKGIQESKGTITSYENLSNKEVFNSCASSVLACLQCTISANKIMKGIEQKYINAMNRYCGFKIMGEVASCYMSDESMTSCFNWFCSALRKNTNILAHYSDDLVGMGEYLLDKCRITFYEIYYGIIKQLKKTTNLETIKFLLNCTEWRIGATDHQYILKSGIIELLKEGNGEHRREKNPIKYCWGHRINFQPYSGSETLSHVILESLEFILMACFSRVLGQDEDKDISMKKAGSSVQSIQQAYSVVNTNITEVLMATSFEIIFNQLSRYSHFIKDFDPIDWQLFVKKRNEMRGNHESFDPQEGYVFEDEKTKEEISKEKEQEEKELAEEDAKLDEEAKQEGAVPRDRVKEVLDRRIKKELDKVHTLYDEKVILKLLRLLEVFTSIALKNEKIHQFVIQVTRPAQILSLLKLLLYCQSRHGLVTLKIFNNLLRIGIEKEILDEAFLEYKQTDDGKKLFDIEVKTQFEDCPFLQFCFNFLYKIRSSQWDKRSIESYGSYNISCAVARLLKSILRSNMQPVWKEKLESVMDKFINNIDTYSIEEFDILISLFQGGEYEGLNTGAYGKTKEGNKFTTVGFVKRWYDLSTPDGQSNESDFKIQEVSPDLTSKDDYLLAIYYDEKHPERNDMFLAIPDEVSLITSLSSVSHDYLLNKERLNNFLKAMEIETAPSKGDPVSLTKRCVGMKILVEQIMTYGDDIAKLFDESFRNKLVNYLLKECASPEEKKNNMKCEWYEQKIYSLKKYATESQTGLKHVNETTITFNGKMLSVCTTLPGSNELYYECMNLTSALNYGTVTQKHGFKVVSSDEIPSLSYRNDNIAVVDASLVDTPAKCIDVFKHLDVVVTTNLDIKGLHAELIAEADKNTAYFKSIVIVSQGDFANLNALIRDGAKVKNVIKEGMNDHEALCEELNAFCNIDKADIEKIFKEKEEVELKDKIRILVDWSTSKEKKDEHKEDKKEEDKKDEEDKKEYDEVPSYESMFGLESQDQLRVNINDFAQYANNNYSSQSQSKTQKGELYSAAYALKTTSDLIGEYANTLASLYKQLCRKTISSFFAQLSIENLLDIILTSEENFELFVKYIQIRGNEAAMYKKTSGNKESYDNFVNLIHKIIKIAAAEEKYSKLIDIIFNKVLIQGTAKLLKNALKEKKKDIKSIFGDEASAVKALNLYLIPDVIKETPKSFLENDDNFLSLFNILLLIPTTFRDEKEFNKSVYMSVYKLLQPVVQNPSKYSLKLKAAILSCKILKMTLEKVNYQVSISSSECLTNEQKILFEIYLLIRQLDEATEDYSSIFSYPEKILEVERAKKILKEMKEFDMVSYLTYYEKELTDEEKDKKIHEETLHNRYKGKVAAKFEYSGFKQMEIKVDAESKLEGVSGIGFSTDPEGLNVVKKVTQIDIDKNETSVKINSDRFYIHYPYNPPKILCWGYGYDYRLGNNDSGTTTSAPIEMNNFSKPMKCLYSRSGFTLGLGKDGKLYWTGYRSDWGGYKYTMTQYDNTFPSEKVIDLKCGSYNCALLTENHEIWIQGYCTGYHLDNGSTKSYFWKKERPNEETERVLNWDVGYNYHVYTTECGKCYGAGNDFMRGIDLECTSKAYVQIPFEEGIRPIKPVCTNNSETYKPLIMFVENNGKSELWSAGYSGYGLLGQGQDKNESKKFAKLDYDSNNITFVRCNITYYAGMALTDDGRLFAWGSNNSSQSGLPEQKTYYSPVEIPFFKDYYVHDFAMGDYHSMICASPKDNMETKRTFLIGDIRGISDLSGKTNEGILHYKPLDNSDYTYMACGEQTFYLCFEGENKASANLGIHKDYTCEVTNQSPITGTMHFWRSEDKNWHFVSQEGYEKLKEDAKEIPDICFTTKYPIKDIQGKEWPEFDAKDLLQDEANVNGPVYCAHNAQGESKLLPVPSTTEKGVFKKEAHDVNPLIFYRLARPLKADAQLPTLNLSNYHEESEYHGFKLEITPNYTYEKSDDVIKIQKEKYKKVVNGIKDFNEKFDGELLEAIESHITKNGVDFINYPSTEIDAEELVFNGRELKALSKKDVQPRVNAFLEFNKNFMLTIPFVILEEEIIKQVTEGKAEVSGETLSILFMISKHMAFRAIKNSYIKKIADSLPTNYDEPEIEINRMLIRHRRDKGKVDNKGEWSTFGVVFKKAKAKNYEYLRKCNSSYKAWRAKFMGEGSIDAGGPYRESVENIIDELQSTCLPLLIPTQNKKNDHGLNRDCWTINPSSTSPHHMEMYKFLGALIGMAFRAGHVMDLKFPPIFWKKFMGEPITVEDLAGTDAYAVQAIKDLEKNKSQIPPDMFVDTMDLNFTTQLSNGETVPICVDGERRKVQYDDVEEYHRLILKTRSEEGSRQIQAMRDGFEIIFPMSILGILSWRDVEERVRGPSEISVEALKSITEYSSCSSDNEYVQRFWRVFEEFTNNEKSMFLKFVWGRSRLPPTERLKDQNFKLYLMDGGRFSNHDTHFPEAHTCFFQLDLPRYTTDEACKSKTLYAIAACGEIDTDGSSYSITDAGGNYDDSD